MRVLAVSALLCACLGAAYAQDKPEIFAQLGHSQGVMSLAFTPDGSVLASGGADNVIKIWEVASGREIRTLGPHYPSIALAYSPDGRILASATIEQGIKLLDAATGQELRTLTGHLGAVFSVAFSPDGRLLASGGADKTIRLWDPANGQVLGVIRGFSHIVDSVVFSPDGRYLAANSDDHAIRVWETATGNELRRMKGYAVGFIAFSPDSQTIASGGSINSIKLWDVTSGQELGSLRGHTGYVAFLAFSRDGRVLASSSFDRTVKLWDLTSGRVLASLTGEARDAGPLWATSLAFAPNETRMALGLSDGTLKLLDEMTGREVKAFGGNAVGAHVARFSPDGRLVASGGFDGTIKIWDKATGHELRVLGKHASYVTDVAFTPDGNVLASAAADQTVKLWDVASGRELRTLAGHADTVESIAFSPNGLVLASGSDDRTIKFWDVATGREVRTLRGSPSNVNSVAFSPDGRTLVSGSGRLGDGNSRNDVVKLWDVASGRVLRTLAGHTKWVSAVAFSPDGTLVASSSDDRTVKLWDAANGREVRTFGGFIDRVSCVTFSPDGRALAAGSHDSFVKVWDVTSGSEVRTFAAHSDVVNSVAYSPDGQLLLTASWGSEVRIWDGMSGRERAAFVAFNDGSSLAITPEGYYDASSEKAEDSLNVRVGSRIFPIASYRDKFYRPDLVRLSVGGGSLAQLGFGGIGSVNVAPLVDLVGLPQSSSEAKLTVNVRLTDAGGGIGQVRLFLNGTAVVQDNTPAPPGRNSGAPVNRSYVVQLADGPNVLQVEAYNSDNSMNSNSGIVPIAANLPPATRAGLHALVIGIQEFKNPNFNLAYPVKDAELFADTLKRYSAALFPTLDIRLLTSPADTTRASVIKALNDMRTAANPDDLFVFYVASHGLTDDGEYYLITSDVGSASTEHLKTDAVSKEELTALVANIPATKKLMIIDTCHAETLGNALQAGLMTRGLDEVTALKILSRAVGTTVLAASTSTQEALEGYKDHGLFSYVLAQGLMGKGEVDKNGVVNTLALAHYVDDQVPMLALSQFNHAQYPTVETNGQAFPLTATR